MIPQLQEPAEKNKRARPGSNPKPAAPITMSRVAPILHKGIGKEPAEKDCRAHPGSNPKPASNVNQQRGSATHAAKEGYAPQLVLLLATSSKHSQAQQSQAQQVTL